LHKKYNAKRIVVSTYQSVTGTGKKAVDQLHGRKKKKHLVEMEQNIQWHINTPLI
jgi:aspartate-semialdehyde dehydrogenase